MEILEISKENALKAFKSANQEGKRLLTDLFPGKLSNNVMDRVKSYEDACLDLCIKSIDYSVFPDFVDKPGLYAFHQLSIIALALNEGWVPDWSDHDQHKYYPWFRYEAGGSSGFSYYGFSYDLSDSAVGSRLVFKSKELAEYAGKQFNDIYNKFLSF